MKKKSDIVKAIRRIIGRLQAPPSRRHDDRSKYRRRRKHRRDWREDE